MIPIFSEGTTLLFENSLSRNDFLTVVLFMIRKLNCY